MMITMLMTKYEANKCHTCVRRIRFFFKNMMALMMLVHYNTNKSHTFVTRYSFIQNGDEVMHKLEQYIDGWNREDVTSTFDFDSETYKLQADGGRDAALQFIQSMLAKGHFVTTADYTASNESVETAQSIANACSVGAVPSVADIYLTRLPTNPVICD